MFTCQTKPHWLARLWRLRVLKTQHRCGSADSSDEKPVNLVDGVSLGIQGASASETNPLRAAVQIPQSLSTIPEASLAHR